MTESMREHPDGEQGRGIRPRGVVVLMALTSVAVRQTVANADFLLAAGVPVMVLTAEPVAFHDHGLDARVPVIDLTRSEVASLPHRGTRRLARLRSLGLPGRAVNAAGHQAYKVFRPLVLWRAAEQELARHLDLDDIAEIVLADAHAVPLGWHIGRARPDLRISFSLDRDAYSGRTGSDAPPESSQL